ASGHASVTGRAHVAAAAAVLAVDQEITAITVALGRAGPASHVLAPPVDADLLRAARVATGAAVIGVVLRVDAAIAALGRPASARELARAIRANLAGSAPVSA